MIISHLLEVWVQIERLIESIYSKQDGFLHFSAQRHSIEFYVYLPALNYLLRNWKFHLFSLQFVLTITQKFRFFFRLTEKMIKNF